MEVAGGPWFEGRRQWRDPGKRSLTEFTEVSGEKEGAGVYGGGLPYAQYPEGTADLRANAAAADPQKNSPTRSRGVGGNAAFRFFFTCLGLALLAYTWSSVEGNFAPFTTI